MTLVEVCEPLFQHVCRLNRSARKGVSPEMTQVRGEIKAIMADCRNRALRENLSGQFERVEVILLYFADGMIRTSKLSWAREWQDLAAEMGRLAGDEEFFDQLDQTLKDTSDEATERLAVFYTCLGLGFTGWYAGQGEYLRKKMQEMGGRLRGMMDGDRAGRIVPEAYEHVNTSDLVQPPGRKLVGVGIVLIGLAVTLFAANVAMYLDKRSDMGRSLRAILDRRADGGKGAAR